MKNESKEIQYLAKVNAINDRTALSDERFHIKQTACSTSKQVKPAGASYCGELIWSHDWHFISAEHAMNTLISGMTQRPCKKCLGVLIAMAQISIEDD